MTARPLPRDTPERAELASRIGFAVREARRRALAGQAPPSAPRATLADLARLAAARDELDALLEAPIHAPAVTAGA